MADAQGWDGDPAAAGRDDWDAHWASLETANEENPAQAYRRALVIEQVHRIRPVTRILDVGCGQGDLLAALAEQWPDAELCGLDHSAEGLRQARSKVPRARFVQADLSSGTLPDELAGWADVAVCSEVLEHVEDPVQLLEGVARGVAPNGAVVVTVPGGPRTAFDVHIGHRRHFSVADLERVVRDAGLDVVRASGAGFPFFNLYKLVTLARGKALVRDVAGAPSRLASLAMRTFARVLEPRWNLSSHGWQRVAVARRPVG